jgi:N-acetylglucosaminyldiphosphoundecaprenol N-acetyl-beta-D-mannosaminyltransferase
VLGIGFDRLDLAAAAALILDRADRGVRSFVITANPEFVMLARGDRELADIARRSDIVVADGAGIVAGAHLLGDALARVPGRLLVDALVPRLASRGASIFLLGAAPGVAERAADTLRRRHPALPIAGCYAGEPTDDGTVTRVAGAAPDVVLVAYGMPKQERWIARNLDALPTVKIAIGVGGVFDQLAGIQKVPPPLVHRLGLEWLWRLLRDPARWRRQRVLPLFAALIVRKRLLGR